MNIRFCVVILAGLITAPTVSLSQCVVPDFQLPPDTAGAATFALNLDYPDDDNTFDRFTTATDFRTDWQGYLNEVLAYALEGNVENNFVVQSNALRGWYHTPWLHAGHSGREYVHGLTRERTSPAGELQEGVNRSFQNWGIGFYNEAAGTQLAKIWRDFCNPSLTVLQDVNFPEGSVSFKVLFTEASEVEIDALAGAPTWTAHIHPQGVRPGIDRDHSRPLVCDRTEDCPRELRTVSLLQIDVAVKDARAGDTGWVFGTFVYDQRVPGTSGWKKLRPISIGWGNDPSVMPGDTLEENKINADFENVFFGWNGRKELGWNGRANGPVDNPQSSCVACHGSAQFPRSDTFANILPSDLVLGDIEMLRVYFRNIAAGELFDPDVVPRFPYSSDVVVPVSLDYSLQTQLGLEQLCFAWIDSIAPFAAGSAQPDICPDRRGDSFSGLEMFTLSLPLEGRSMVERLLIEERDLPVSKDSE